jgi:hypothetical protein
MSTRDSLKSSKFKIPRRKLPREQLPFSFQFADTDLVEDHLRRLTEQIRLNQVNGKDVALFLHSLSKVDQHTVPSEVLSSFLLAFEKKINRNVLLAQFLTHIDIVLMMNSIGKFAKTSEVGVCNGLLSALAEEIPSRISLFEDHHLALLLKSSILVESEIIHVIIEILRELQNNREWATFSAQTVVIIASALSRLRREKYRYLPRLWASLLDRVMQFREEELQPNWADVLLTSLEFADVHPDLIQPELVDKLLSIVFLKHKKGLLSDSRLQKAVKSSEKLKCKEI